MSWTCFLPSQRSLRSQRSKGNQPPCVTGIYIHSTYYFLSKQLSVNILKMRNTQDDQEKHRQQQGPGQGQAAAEAAGRRVQLYASAFASLPVISTVTQQRPDSRRATAHSVQLLSPRHPRPPQGGLVHRHLPRLLRQVPGAAAEPSGSPPLGSPVSPASPQPPCWLPVFCLLSSTPPLTGHVYQTFTTDSLFLHFTLYPRGSRSACTALISTGSELFQEFQMQPESNFSGRCDLCGRSALYCMVPRGPLTHCSLQALLTPSVRPVLAAPPKSLSFTLLSSAFPPPSLTPTGSPRVPGLESTSLLATLSAATETFYDAG